MKISNFNKAWKGQEVSVEKSVKTVNKFEDNWKNGAFHKKIPNNQKEIAAEMQQLAGGRGKSWWDDGSAGIELDKDLGTEERRKLADLISSKFKGKIVGDGAQEGMILIDGQEI